MNATYSWEGFLMTVFPLDLELDDLGIHLLINPTLHLREAPASLMLL